jgi:uncharacterized protein (DUF1015 family)
MLVHPFRALRPPTELAARVAAVPYDVVDTKEARDLAAGNSHSFLHVSRPDIAFADGFDAYAPAVYARGAEDFARMQAAGALAADREPGLFVYSQRMGEHVQHGITACIDTREYEANIIRKHEKTRVDKEEDRVRHIRLLRSHTEPVFIAYRDDSTIDRLVNEAQKQRPLFQFKAPDGIEHSGWRLPAPDKVAAAFKRVPVCYIADGHHRAAAAARVAAEMAAGGEGGDEYCRFLAVLFPASQLRIFPINRCIENLNGLTPERFLAEVRRVFQVSEDAPPQPVGPGRISMCLGGRWYGLNWDVARDADPVTSLDVSVLQDRLLGPVLGVVDPRRDPRLEFVAGIRGMTPLTERIGDGRAAVVFTMYPVGVEQVMAVSDAGLIMPPKSTWFEPKLRSGLFVHVF